MHKRKSKTLWTRSCLKASTVLLLSVQGRCYSVQKWLLEWLQGLAPGGRTVVWRVTPLAFLGAHVSSGTLLPPSLLNVSFYSKAARKANKQIKPSRDIKVTMLCKKKPLYFHFFIRSEGQLHPHHHRLRVIHQDDTEGRSCLGRALRVFCTWHLHSFLTQVWTALYDRTVCEQGLHSP